MVQQARNICQLGNIHAYRVGWAASMLTLAPATSRALNQCAIAAIRKEVGMPAKLMVVVSACRRG